MKTSTRTWSTHFSMARRGHVANDRVAWTHSSFNAARAMMIARRRRELVLAWSALIALIVCWDISLRLDERISPPRVRMSHAVELEGEPQTLSLVP